MGYKKQQQDTGMVFEVTPEEAPSVAIFKTATKVQKYIYWFAVIASIVVCFPNRIGTPLDDAKTAEKRDSGAASLSDDDEA